ncbi:proteasome subunit alpha type 2 [Heterostelium album PN500]|uniref:Proteasome subunit alpha type n=1 Tax=Heterostelium pallidum (strain ATCC 26659 / Pp 5 / PN500) TaxID=670386 RepID=D3B770_HETP5|nr:proteasome subunit alpha type 2 [Heterostelium album PN500]EFA82613.1 proteasome subunit alpha type 2 [Heterostelium album PN500]|eukprot:XP_020434730.1 proteasome subunit alpha type 2 [Heterostelium album PN500]
MSTDKENMDSDYSFSLTTFSPSGKLVQIEHALHAAGAGGSAIGLKAKNGVVIVTEKKLHPLVDVTSVQKIALITENIGLVYAGMGPDSRVLIKKARKEAEKYDKLYKEKIPVLQLVREIASIMQEFTQSGGVRPFGVSLLVAGFDDKGPHLYQVDPSGSYFAWKATAIGKNMVNSKTFLEKRYSDDLEIEDAVQTALITLKEGFETQLLETNMELAVVGADKKFKILSASEIKDYLANL